MTHPLPPVPEDLAERLGLEPEDLEDPVILARLTTVLRDATTLVLAEVGAARAAAWRDAAPDVVQLVVFTAARRGYENPRGLYQETLGEHTIGASDTSGVYLTARELAQIARAASGRSGGFVGSIRTPSAYGPT